MEDHFEVYRVDVMSERYKNIMHRKFCVIDLEVAMHGTSIGQTLQTIIRNIGM